MEPENVSEQPELISSIQNNQPWWYYPLGWCIQLIVFTTSLAVVGWVFAWVLLAILNFIGFTQQYNLIALAVYGLVTACSVWLGLNLDRKYHFHYFISANLLGSVMAILLLTLASVFSLYGNYRESYGWQSSLRNAQMNLQAAAELYYEQNNRSYEGFCKSEYVQEVRIKADSLTAKSKAHNHLLACAATKESYAIEIPYFEPMQERFLCISANTGPIATSISVFTDNGLCSNSTEIGVDRVLVDS